MNRQFSAHARIFPAAVVGARRVSHANSRSKSLGSYTLLNLHGKASGAYLVQVAGKVTHLKKGALAARYLDEGHLHAWQKNFLETSKKRPLATAFSCMGNRWVGQGTCDHDLFAGSGALHFES